MISAALGRPDLLRTAMQSASAEAFSFSPSFKNHNRLQCRIKVGIYGFGGGMLLTYREALDRLGSRHYVRKAVSLGQLHPIGRGMYSTDEHEDSLAVVARRYPDGILTGQTALYVHGLIDMPPDRIDLATKRGGTKISDRTVRQNFVPAERLEVGKTRTEVDGVSLPVYDQERMLLELMRTRNKLPYDLYREAVASYRKRADEIDIYKLQDYAERMPRGGAYLDRAMEEVF